MTSLFGKILEAPWYAWMIIALLIALGASLSVSGRRGSWTSRRLASAAMCLAVAFILSYIRLFRMPQGGSVTLCSMLPIVAFSLAFGPLQGLVVGVAYGLLQLIQDLYVIHPLQVLLDYPMAFGALALGGIAGLLPIPEGIKLPCAVLLGAFFRFVLCVASGAIFFREYAAEGQTALAYSLLYNLSYLGPDALFCTLVSCLPVTKRILPLMRDGRP